MKKSFSFIVGIFIVFCLNAQVVIQYNTHAPVKGTSNLYSEVEFLEPGVSGKNLVWDFTKADPTESYRNTSFTNVDAVDAAKFNLNVTHVLKENDNRYFQELTKETYAITGFINEDFIIHYDEPLVRMFYPFTYTDNFESSLVATAINKNNNSTEIDGNYSVYADAYGKILLPGNVVKDVLRVAHYSTSVQVTACREVNIESKKFSWYSSEDRYPIATTIIQEQRFCNGDVHVTQETWINQKYLKSNKLDTDEIFVGKKHNVEIFPNPFVSNAEMILDLYDDANVELGLCNLVGEEIYTIQAKSNLEKGQYFYKINSDELNLKPGMYFVKILVDNDIESIKLIRK